MPIPRSFWPSPPHGGLIMVGTQPHLKTASPRAHAHPNLHLNIWRLLTLFFAYGIYYLRNILRVCAYTLKKVRSCHLRRVNPLFNSRSSYL